jgi:hypothetical protein
MRKWFNDMKMTTAEDVKVEFAAKAQQDGQNELSEEQR